jgi:hypothetical protein
MTSVPVLPVPLVNAFDGRNRTRPHRTLSGESNRGLPKYRCGVILRFLP